MDRIAAIKHWALQSFLCVAGPAGSDRSFCMHFHVRHANCSFASALEVRLGARVTVGLASAAHVVLEDVLARALQCRHTISTLDDSCATGAAPHRHVTPSRHIDGDNDTLDRPAVAAAFQVLMHALPRQSHGQAFAVSVCGAGVFGILVAAPLGVVLQAEISRHVAHTCKVGCCMCR